LLDDLTALGEDVDLAFPLVHVDANMVHGWPLPSAALTAGCSCGQSMPPRQARGQPLHPIYALWHRAGSLGVSGWSASECGCYVPVLGPRGECPPPERARVAYPLMSR